MNTTAPSLFVRLRDPSDYAAWREFDARYRDLLLNFCRRRGVPYADAEDVVQKVFADLAKSLPQFTYDRQRGRFRNYLYRCVTNTLADWAARPNRRWQPLSDCGDARLAGPGHAVSDDIVQRIWEQEWTDHHLRLAMQTVRRTFDERSVSIFERSIAGAKVAELAGEFQMTEAAVHKVRQRIRGRMQELIAAQIREEDDLGSSNGE